MKKEIKKLLEKNGPMTGSELLSATGEDSLVLWRTCRLAKELTIRSVGARYLRLDRGIEGFVRLSPSILREFLTYSVIGLSLDHASILERVEKMTAHVEAVSAMKSELAFRMVSALESRLENELRIKDMVCFIIAGDIVHNMAHDVLRPERSTGKLVRGSDIDLVVLVNDLIPKRLIERLDEGIYEEKFRLLTTPHLKEEIDYVVKDINRVREQVKFDTFRHMLACKILHEGALLFGHEEIFNSVKALLTPTLQKI